MVENYNSCPAANVTEDIILLVPIINQNLTIVAINHLDISLCGNLNMPEQVSCEKKETKKRKQNSNIVPIVVPIVGISILLLSVAAIWLGIKRRRQNGKTCKYLFKSFCKYKIVRPNILLLTCDDAN